MNHSIDYEYGGGDSLFRRWEAGEATALPAPLATRSGWYRKVILGLARHYCSKPGASLISLGAGNGFAERELAHAGFNVLATDISLDALAFCRAKGLATRHLDLSLPLPPDLAAMDIAYADGLLGHLLVDPDAGAGIWAALADMVQPGGICLLSNDLADTDLVANLGVAADPNALFLRPPSGWFSEQAVLSGRWSFVWSRVLTYRRPGRGLRRRELLVLSRDY